MIESLRIERVAIVDEAELDFGPGLNVLTGETGAGKSIVLGALGWLVGERASSDALRSGAKSGAVEAVFRTDCHPELEQALRERGLEPDDHDLIVRREVLESGRGRCRVAGQRVPVATLAELFGGRIEISSQHSSHALLRLESHGRLLDEAGGLAPLRREVEEGYEKLRSLDRELAALREAAGERERRRDFLAFQVQEIDEVGLQPGELAEIERSHARLAHAEQHLEGGRAALTALAGAPDGDGAGAIDLVSQARRQLEALARLDEALAPLVEALGAAGAELGETAAELERRLADLEVDPAALARVEERLARIERLRRKYGRSEDEILAFRRAAGEELAGLSGADERGTELERLRLGTARALAETASKLSEARAAAASELSAAVEAGLRELAMPAARFGVSLDPAEVPAGLPCGPHGLETPEFRFGANAGEPPRPLRKVASGGELSRVFLALKNALRRTGLGVVLVFDEVDAGIGGRTAERVGRALAELAAHHQVVCITHLPQIAAAAEVHFRVAKAEVAGRTVAGVERVEGAARVDELARMAGGEHITPATRRHARDLLAQRVAGRPRPASAAPKPRPRG